jgi:hypothetical protein
MSHSDKLSFVSRMNLETAVQTDECAQSLAVVHHFPHTKLTNLELLRSRGNRPGTRANAHYLLL